MQTAWQLWKRGFDAWESTTAEYLDGVLRNRVVLAPAAALLGATVRAKRTGDRAFNRWWKSVGLPTKRDQERAQHALNLLESRLLDLEERLDEIEQLEGGNLGNPSHRER